MPPRRDGQVPLEALRDLIGVVRSLYAAWKAGGANSLDLEELANIGKDLSEALRLAKRAPANTLGHRAAWSRAEAATERFGHLVTALEPIRPALVAATRRVIGKSSLPTSAEREAKRRHERSRS